MCERVYKSLSVKEQLEIQSGTYQRKNRRSIQFVEFYFYKIMIDPQITTVYAYESSIC